MISQATVVRRAVLMIALISVGLACAASPRDASGPDGGDSDGFGDEFRSFDVLSALDGGANACNVAAAPIAERSLTLTSTDVAVRLAGFLWNRPADSPLLARTASLRTTKDVAALAMQMQGDPRFQQRLDSFFTQWLDLQTLPNAKPTGFNGFDASLAADMTESAFRFVRGTFLDPDGTFSTLLESPKAWVNERLAPLYGVSFDAANGAWQNVALPSALRAGISTSLARMTAAPRATARGSWIASTLLCQGPIPPHPPGLDSSLGTGPGSYRQRLMAATSDARCAACHQSDNLGFAFEHFDDAGLVRDSDNGFPVDSASSFTFSQDGPVTFDGAPGLIKVLASGCDARLCFVEQWLAVAFGNGQDPFISDTDTVKQVLSATMAANFRLGAMLSAITETPAFLAP